MIPNSRDKIGIVLGQGQWRKWFIDNRFPHYRVSALWGSIVHEGDGYLKPVLEDIKSLGGTVLLDLFAIPASLDTTQPLINRWHFPAIAGMKEDFVAPWEDWLYGFILKWENYIDLAGVLTETNIANTWRDADTLEKGTMEQHLELVVKPAKKVLDKFNIPLVAGSPTLRGDDAGTFNESTRHFKALQKHGEGVVNHLDFHAYRDTAAEVISDIEEFFRRVEPKKKLFITEGFGFNGKECFSFGEKIANFFKYFKTNRGYTPDQKQLRNYKKFLPWLIYKQEIKRAYFFGAYTGYGDSLLNVDGSPRPAAEHIREFI